MNLVLISFLAINVFVLERAVTTELRSGWHKIKVVNVHAEFAVIKLTVCESC